jgi:hypothetical protein
MFNLAVTSVTTVTEKRGIPPSKLCSVSGAAAPRICATQPRGITEKLVTAVTERLRDKQHRAPPTRRLVGKPR